MDVSVERFRPLVDLVVAALRRDPSVTAQQQILVAAIVFVLVSVLVLLFLLAFTPKKRRVVRRRRIITAEESSASLSTGTRQQLQPEGSVESKPPPRPAFSSPLARLLLGLPGMLLVAAVLAVAAYVVTDTTAYCTYQCHQTMIEPELAEEDAPRTARPIPIDAVVLAEDSAHHERCTGCHRADIATDVFDRSRMVVASFSGSSEASASAVVSSASCLDCHGYVLEHVVIGVGGSIRMSHAEPYAAGMSCVTCHSRIGHEGAASPRMSSCLECHDAEQVISTCETCHVGNPSDQSSKDRPEGSASKRAYRLVELDSNRCYECHDPAPCDSCHRVRVPHTTEFLTGRHARPAAWAGKQQCRRCHDQNMCSGCHQGFAGSHYQGWESDHRKLTPTANCGCHDRRRPERTEPFCTVCHW
jgi:hypothetical protein